MNTTFRGYSALLLTGSLALATYGCGESKHGAASKAAAGDKSDSPGAEKDSTSQIIAVDGSSTVYPITEAVAEEFQKTGKGRVTIGVSGTGGGFKKFCKAETDVSGASRPIKPTEVSQCKDNGVEYVELPVAYDGLAIVVNPKAEWVDHLTVDELKKLWAPEAQEKVLKWSDVRPGWPDREIHLFGPGVDSGTYDYFTKAIVGKEHSSRGDFTSSEDDNVLVQGIATDELALGFFGFAYYESNKDKLKLIPVDDGQEDNGSGAIAPSLETVANGTYQPLSRPIFVYVAKKSADRPAVDAFVKFYLGEGANLTKEVGYIPLPSQAYELATKRYTDRVTGSVFGGDGSTVGVSVEDLLARK